MTLLTVTINAGSIHFKSTGKNANLQYKHSDKEKTKDSKAMKNEIGGHLSVHHHSNTLAYNTTFSMLITSKMGCATGLMSLVSDLNHEWQSNQQINGEKDRTKLTNNLPNGEPNKVSEQYLKYKFRAALNVQRDHILPWQCRIYAHMSKCSPLELPCKVGIVSCGWIISIN